MGGVCMNTKLRQLFTIAALIVLSLAMLKSSTSAFAQDSDGPEGSWYYTVSIPGYTFHGIETYSEGGGYTETDQLSFSPFSVASPGHGVWQSTGNNKFVLTYVNLTFDAFNSGKPTGMLKVRQTTKIDKTGNSYSGSGDYMYYDVNGNPIPGLSGTFTISATRIQVQAPGN